MKYIKLKNSDYMTVVDDEDFEYLKKYNWFLHKNRNCSYAKRNIRINKEYNSQQLMHRQIMKLNNGDPDQIDHIDGNGLNNCKENLRIATQRENMMNRTKNFKSMNKYKGVYFNKHSKMYLARLKKYGKIVWFKYSKSEIEACKAYNKAAKKYFGHFAKLNIIGE